MLEDLPDDGGFSHSPEGPEMKCLHSFSLGASFCEPPPSESLFEMVSACMALKMTWELSVMMMDLVFLPWVASMSSFPWLLP